MAAPGTLRWPRFTIRWLLGLMFLAALACGWYSSLRPQNVNEAQAASIEAGTSAFQRSSFRDCQLSGAVLRGDGSTFQLAQFDGARLGGATLICNGASFQGSSFDGANLSGASLSGTGSALQRSSFAGADLSGAVLAGDDTAFQGASLAGAKLAGVKFRAGNQSLQCLTIDGAQFQRADLSQLNSGILAGWTFQTPPLYDDQTRFPAGFDPAALNWSRATEP